MNPATYQAYRAAREANDSDLALRYMSALIIQMEPFVARHARRLAQGDFEDLMQAGRMGLARAIADYDATRGGALRAFAFKKINDAFDDEVISRRAQVPAGPRYLRTETTHGLCKMPQHVKRAQQAFFARTGREATAEDLGVDADDLAMWGRVPRALPYDEAAYDEDHVSGDNMYSARPGVIAAAVRDVSNVLSRKARATLGAMTLQEQRIFSARVFEEMDFVAIAQSEGVSRDVVTCIYNKAVSKLRAALK